jgi:hypothetical protein
MWTLKDIEKSPVAHLNTHLLEKTKVKQKEKYSKQKYWINFRLEEFARENDLVLKTEHRFDEVRKWRFDWCLDEIKLAVEYEGVFSKKSRHTTVKGFTGDTDKYNAAQQLGWTVLRYTAINYLDLMIDLNNYKK